MSREAKRSRCESQKKEKEKTLQFQSMRFQPTTIEILDAYELPLFDHGWPIYLQLQMLDALCLFGNQNWEMAAQYINSQFNSEQVRDHYYMFYGDHSLADQHYLPEYILVEDQGFDIYIMAKKKHLLRERNQQKREKKKKIQEQEDYPQKKEEFIKKRLPPQFGYEQHKKLFAQALNQEAQIMILQLSIEPNDNQDTKASKIKVLKQYDKMVTQRGIVEKQVMNNDLMECKYSIPSKNLVNPNTQSFNEDMSSSNRLSSARKKNPSKSKRNVKKQAFAKSKKQRKQDIFFSLKRIENQQLMALHFVYMKMMKYDQNNQMKELLKAYEKKCQEQKLLKRKIIQEA